MRKCLVEPEYKLKNSKSSGTQVEPQHYHVKVINNISLCDGIKA